MKMSSKAADPENIVLKRYSRFQDAAKSRQAEELTTTSGSSLNELNCPHLSHINIRSVALDLVEVASFFATIDWSTVSLEAFHSATCEQLNVAFLLAAYEDRADLLEGFVRLGVHDFCFSEAKYKFTALHLAAYRGHQRSVKYLIFLKRNGNFGYGCGGCSPLHCAVLGNRAETVKLLLESAHFPDDFHGNSILHCAIWTNSADCLRVLCAKVVDLNLLSSNDKTPLHLACELGRLESLQILLRTNRIDVNRQTKEKLQTALHFAAAQSQSLCVQLLLEHGALSDVRDYKNQTPLQLATSSRCIASVKLLLERGRANPNVPDLEERTALHAALTGPQTENANSIVKCLLRYGADIHKTDSLGYTPLHLAAENELSDCVETLILNNANVMANRKSGVTALRTICRRTPSGLDAITRKLDESIVAVDVEDQSELRIDFGIFIRHSFPNEVAFLNALLDEDQKQLLLHPVCRAFLYLKWKKMRKFLVFRAICYFVLVLAMSAYVLMGVAKHCYNFSKNYTVVSYESDSELCLNRSLSGHIVTKYPRIIEIEWYVMLVISLGIILRKLYIIPGYSSFRGYIGSMETILDWSTALVTFLISFTYTGRTYTWQNHVSAFGVLLAWINFLHILGQFPFFGTYVAMYSSVQNEFAKLLLVFSCLLIGFTVSFCVLFPDVEIFSNICVGLITVLVMAIGEMNLDLIASRRDENDAFTLRGSSEVIYAIFVTSVTIILLNLLVGIAVQDIQGLRKSAKLSKLVKTARLICRIEKALNTDYLHQKLLFTTRVTKDGCEIAFSGRDRRVLPDDILREAREIAVKKGRRNKESSGSLDELQREVKCLQDQVVVMRQLVDENRKIMEAIFQKIMSIENKCV